MIYIKKQLFSEDLLEILINLDLLAQNVFVRNYNLNRNFDEKNGIAVFFSRVKTSEKNTYINFFKSKFQCRR